MTLTAGVINLPVRPDMSGFGTSVTTQSRGVFGSLGKSMSTMSKALIAIPIVGAVIAGVGAATSAVAGWIQQAEDAAATARELKNTVSEMGRVAGVTAAELLEMNRVTGLQVGIDDDLITAGTNLLVTFGHIRDEQGKGNDIMTQANTLMVDYAAKFTDGNFQSAATQLGKALEDPIKGMSALARVGVTFTAQDQKTIESLIKHNKLLEAQKIILGAIRPQVVGTAKAGSTATEKLTNAWGEFTEFLGSKLLPIVNPVMKDITRLIQSLMKETNKQTSVWEKVWKEIVKLWDKYLPVIKQRLAAFFAWAGGALKDALMDAILGGAIEGAVHDVVLSALGHAADVVPGSTGGGNVGSVRQHAAGGIVTRPHVGLVGEAGPEAIIPLSRGQIHVIVDNPQDIGDGGAGTTHAARMVRTTR